MARGHGRGRRRGGAEHESGERWLLTYADMITLLMALFMVLFSISSVNVSKVQALQKSLKSAFSPSILPGGKALAQQGSTVNASQAPPASLELQAIEPVTKAGASGLQGNSVSSQQSAAATSGQETASQREQNEFAQIKHELDAYAAAHGFGASVTTTIEPRGLVIKVLTDDLLFATGSAALEERGDGLLSEIAQLLNVDESHPLDVEGNTDNVPIHSAQFSSNWALSAARASTVASFLVEHGVAPHRLTASGYAEQRPVDSNATAAGRARNRRVQIVMKRIYGGNEGESEPGGESSGEP
jgi:chemotaxis protein MotB